MKTSTPGLTTRQKWTTAVLGVVCLLLVIYIIQSFRSVGKGSAPPPRSGASTPRAGAKGHAAPAYDELANYDPRVHLEELKERESRAELQLDRSPFDYGVTPEERRAKLEAQQAAVNPPPPLPPPPPPIALKAIGYAEAASGQRSAFVGDDVQTYQVQVGESFANRYKVLKITPTAIEIEDESYHQTAELPFPQPQ